MMAMASTERVTVRFDDDQLEQLEERVERGQYVNLSDATRDAVRRLNEEVEMPPEEDGTA